MESMLIILLFHPACHKACYHGFFNDTATAEIYSLSLHDALPICKVSSSQKTGYIFQEWLSAFDRESISFIRRDIRVPSFSSVPSMALILLVKVRSRVFTAKCSEPQVGTSNGMDEGSGVTKFLSLRTET